MPNPFNPQDYNRFSYVRNNPVRYIDPSGHICVQNGGGVDEFGIPGNCNGKPDPKYERNPLLVPFGWTPKGGQTSVSNTGGGGGSPLTGVSGGSGGSGGEGGGGSQPEPIITLDLDSLPGPAALYSSSATGIDIFLLVASGYLELLSVAGVVIGYGSGAAFTGGTPVTGIPGATIGYSIVQMGLQPLMTASNYAGLFATILGTIGDDKAGNSEIGLTVYTSDSGLMVDLDGQVSSSVQASWLITGLSFQGEAQLTETSGLLQLASVANDFDLLPSAPWGTLDLSLEFVIP